MLVASFVFHNINECCSECCFQFVLFLGSIKMVSIAESPANWWKHDAENDADKSEDDECKYEKQDKSLNQSQQRLLPCELIQLSPNIGKTKGYEGTFHQITRYNLERRIHNKGFEQLVYLCYICICPLIYVAFYHSLENTK